MVGDFGWEHEGTKSRVGTVKGCIFFFFKKNFKITNSKMDILAQFIRRHGSRIDYR